MTERRKKVPFDSYYFEQQAKEQKRFSLAETFDYIYESRLWNAAESVSGEGANPSQTEQIKTKLPTLLKQLQVKTLLDLPCGDFNWLSKIPLPIEKYIGGDIVPQLIEQNTKKYTDSQREFLLLDLTKDRLPDADLILCRDCFVHLSFADIESAIKNIRRSAARYLLTTTFTDCEANEDIVSGDWRIINFEKPPFNFPPPIVSINENCTEGNGAFKDKTLGLWEIKDIEFRLLNSA